MCVYICIYTHLIGGTAIQEGLATQKKTHYVCVYIHTYTHMCKHTPDRWPRKKYTYNIYRYIDI